MRLGSEDSCNQPGSSLRGRDRNNGKSRCWELYQPEKDDVSENVNVLEGIEGIDVL